MLTQSPATDAYYARIRKARMRPTLTEANLAYLFAVFQMASALTGAVIGAVFATVGELQRDRAGCDREMVVSVYYVLVAANLGAVIAMTWMFWAPMIMILIIKDFC